MTARRTAGGSAANGFQSMSSGAIALKTACPDWCDRMFSVTGTSQAILRHASNACRSRCGCYRSQPPHPDLCGVEQSLTIQHG